MRRTWQSIGVATASVALGAGLAITAPAAQAQSSGAQSCYGSAKSFSKPSGNRWYPQGGPRLTVTGACNDINIKTDQTTQVGVCFHPSSGSEWCNSFKNARAGQWTVVATDVKRGTQFYFDFGSTAAKSGVWAA